MAEDELARYRRAVRRLLSLGFWCANLAAVVRIALTAEAYAAIASILPPGANIGPLEMAPNGQWCVWLPHAIVDGLARMRGARESYSDVILRLAATGKSA
jgi:hypothetical protein